MIVPYKNRKLDRYKRVRVYRNLSSKGRKKVYSVMQDGVVIGHATELALIGVKFIVQRGGRERVLRDRKKYVHAFVEGYVTESAMGGDPRLGDKLPARVEYDPYAAPDFVVKNLTKNVLVVKEAMAVFINKHGVTAAYIG